MRHDCTYPEVLIEEGDDGALAAGMRVLIPCPECGDTPLDGMSVLQGDRDALARIVVDWDPRRALFHWAPSARRGQIERWGLRPGMRNTTASEGGMPYGVVCLGDSPSWAWALSAEMSWTPDGPWDLWQTALDLLTDPIVLPNPDRSSGVHEVRTEHRIYKRDLWFVGTREKVPRGR